MNPAIASQSSALFHPPRLHYQEQDSELTVRQGLAIARCRRMYKKWPWDDHAAYLDRPLRAIRSEFGITVIPSR